jgi:hypothetical protein
VTVQRGPSSLLGGSSRNVALDRQGNLYIGEQLNSRVRKVTPAGTITTVAGGTRGARIGDGGPATQAPIGKPVQGCRRQPGKSLHRHQLARSKVSCWASSLATRTEAESSTESSIGLPLTGAGHGTSITILTRPTPSAGHGGRSVFSASPGTVSKPAALSSVVRPTRASTAYTSTSSGGRCSSKSGRCATRAPAPPKRRRCESWRGGSCHRLTSPARVGTRETTSAGAAPVRRRRSAGRSTLRRYPLASGGRPRGTCVRRRRARAASYA